MNVGKGIIAYLCTRVDMGYEVREDFCSGQLLLVKGLLNGLQVATLQDILRQASGFLRHQRKSNVEVYKHRSENAQFHITNYTLWRRRHGF